MTATLSNSFDSSSYFFFIFMTVIKYILKVHLYAIKKIALSLSTQLTVDPYVIQFFFFYFLFRYVFLISFFYLFLRNFFIQWIWLLFLCIFCFYYFFPFSLLYFFFTISTPWPKEQFYFCLFLLWRKIGQKLFQFVIFFILKN